MENDSLSATVEPPVMGGEEGIATVPTVYLSARGQDTALVAAVVKARLESQGCLVRHGAAEVRTRSQCAKHYGPLLHDCDVFIQLVGVDPGPILSNEDDDGFWSLQIWEAREAARRKKPARHYLLDEEFCRMMLPQAKRPPQVLKKQERHRRKLASSPTKVRQVRDADELLRLLPIIRLAGDAPESSGTLSSAGTFSAEIAASLAAIAQATAAAVPVSHDAGVVSEVPSRESSPTPDVSVLPQVSLPTEAKPEETVAAVTALDSSTSPVVPAANGHEKPAGNGADVFSMENPGTLSPLPAFPESDEPVAGTPVRFENRRPDFKIDCAADAHLSSSELPQPLPEISLFHTESKNRKTVWVSLPHAFVLETGSVLPPLPALPASPEDCSVSAEAGSVPAPSAPADAPPLATQTGVQPGVAAGASSPEVLPAPSVTAQGASGEEVEAAFTPTESVESVASLAVAIAPGIDEPVVAGSRAFADVEPSVPVATAGEHASAETPELVPAESSPAVAQEAGTKGADAPEHSPQTPSITPAAAMAVVLEKASPAPVEEQQEQPNEPAVDEISLVPKERMEIEARVSRMEIVAQAPMKLELCRVEGHRVSVRPHALERRGLPRRGLPAWMLKKSVDHSSPIKPVAGRRAYAKPSPSEDIRSQDEPEQGFEETLFIPQRPIVRKYHHQRFIIFRLTDSVTVRRLGEASKKKPGVAIATAIAVGLLVGLLAKASLDFFFDGSSPAVEPVASNDPALAAPSRLDISAESRKQTTTKPPKPAVAPKPTTPVASQPQAPVLAAITPASAKAGSDPKPIEAQAASATAPPPAPVPAASTRQIAPAPAGNLDGQQKVLEKELEEAILAMRKSGSSAGMYARQNEATISELQRRIQEMIPIRSGHGFSGSAPSLALSRCLASVHLLGGRRQAARNALLDMRDTIATTRSDSDPELRLADHLLKRTEPVSGSTQMPSPLTPGEMDTLLGKFGSDPQWEPSAGGPIAGDN